MLRPTRLAFEGFKSYKDKAEIIFPRGAVLIQGNWLGSTMSSGSGKSNITLALEYLIDICDKPSTKLKNWDSKKMWVEGDFLDEETGTVYTLRRDPKFSMSINGVPYESLNVGVEEAWDKIIRVPASVRKALVSRPQLARGKFINDTDAKNKEFLAPLLGLDVVENAADSISTEADAYKSKLDSLVQIAESIEGSLPGAFVSDQELQNAKTTYEQAASALQSLQMNSQQSEIQNELRGIRIELDAIGRLKRTESDASYENNTLRNQIIGLQGEIQILLESYCPTCRREWDKGQSLIEDKKATVARLASKMLENVTIIKNAAPILANEVNLTQRAAVLNGKLGELSAPIQHAMQVKDANAASLKLLTEKKDYYNALLSRKANNATEQKNILLDMEVSSHAEAIAGRNGFSASYLDEILFDIERKVNDMLIKIPNVACFTFNLSSTSVTQKGTAKKTISKKLFKMGKELDVSELSGGQQCALEICADMAVRKVIMERSGSKLGWLSLDEAMEGLEPENKLPLLEVLKSEVEGLLLVVDHTTEVKEGFEKVIKIEYDGRESYVV